MTFLFNSKPARSPTPDIAPLQLFVASPAKVEGPSHLPNQLALARQIMHNLQHQHYWTDLQLHIHSPLTDQLLPQPLVSGRSPQRLYVHPDEQVELLKEADSRKKAGESTTLDVRAEPEPEWILPTRLNEKWTLRRLAAIFDAIDIVPPAPASATGPDESVNPWRTTKRVLLGTVDSDSTVVYYIIHDGVVKPRQN